MVTKLLQGVGTLVVDESAEILLSLTLTIHQPYGVVL